MNLRKVTIKLNGTKPVVNRKLVVPDDMSLAVFHLLIQIVMPWENYHLYEFKAGYDRWREELDELGMDFGRAPNLIADECTIAGAVKKTGENKFKYLYDFGDDWEHIISIGAIVNSDPDEIYPKLEEANGICPPEDCGGLGGYYHMLEVLNDSNHEEYEEMKEWIGNEFNPDKEVYYFLMTEVVKFAQIYQKTLSMGKKNQIKM